MSTPIAVATITPEFARLLGELDGAITALAKRQEHKEPVWLAIMHLIDIQRRLREALAGRGLL